MLHTFDKVAESYDRVESEYLKILYYDLEKDFSDTYRSYGNYRLCTMLTGTKDVSINGDKTFSYAQNEYVLLPPHSSVQMHMKSHTKAVVYEINDTLMDKISDQTEISINKENVIYKHHYSMKLRNPLSKLRTTMCEHATDKKFLMDLHAQELVYELLNSHINHQNEIKTLSSYNPVDVARKIMIKEGNEKISIGEIASVLGMSQSNLIYYFKKEMSMTPKQYQNRIKVERGKMLLQVNNVTEVAMILGFDNISHFIRLFKLHYGLTPKQYKQYMSKGNLIEKCS